MGWLDVIGLGIDAATLYQSSKIRKQIGDIQTGQLAESTVQEIIVELKQVLFESLKKFDDVDDLIQTEPLKIYFATQFTNWRLNNLGITPEIFTEFNDKEYALNARKSINNVRDSAAGLLSDDQISDADNGLLALLEMPFLDKSITIKCEKEKIIEFEQELNNTQEEWDLLTEEKKQINKKGLPYIGFSAVGIVLMCLVGGIGTALFGSDSIISMFAQLLSMVVCFGSLALLGVGIITMLRRPTGRYSELSKERSRLRREIKNRQEMEDVPEEFSGLSSDELISLREERYELLRKVIGSEEVDYLLSSSETSLNFS